MFIIVRYHVETITQEGRARLRKVAKTCESHGPRVQNPFLNANWNQPIIYNSKQNFLKL
ncbi:CRISPR-associated protein Cas2 domain protein [Leptospira interrogans str. UI 13372]|nr:CRISPR-associated protein Cas2 domain protein [Leptospira interrogans serovar Bataviae str. UI 08561]EMO95191.1 CRISPR-associated protein Cas2 domain protein [Leptospira interrogans str. UI 13372]